MNRCVLALCVLLPGCWVDSDLPEASPRWRDPTGVRWRPSEPVPDAATVSVELDAETPAEEFFDALKRARIAGAEQHELVGRAGNRVVGLPVEFPGFCPARNPWARVCATARLMLRAHDAELLYLEATPNDCTNRVFEPAQRTFGEVPWLELSQLGPETLGAFELREVGVCDYVGLAAEPDVPIQRVVRAYDALARTGAKRIVFTVGIRERR